MNNFFTFEMHRVHSYVPNIHSVLAGFNLRLRTRNDKKRYVVDHFLYTYSFSRQRFSVVSSHNFRHLLE